MSKTVKRVSRKVKRVMTVMMIGLVAMLGANAEAHTLWIPGQKPRVCSHCYDGKLRVEEHHPIWQADYTVTTKLIEISCQGEEPVQSMEPVTLSAQTPVNRLAGVVAVSFKISDETISRLGSCTDPSVKPIVELLQVQVDLNAYECTDDACANRVLTSTLTYANCTAPHPSDTFFPFFQCSRERIVHSF